MGFVGVSDGRTDIHQHKKMTWEYQRAEDGNVAIVAEIDLSQGEDEFTLSLGFGRNLTKLAIMHWQVSPTGLMKHISAM